MKIEINCEINPWILEKAYSETEINNILKLGFLVKENIGIYEQNTNILDKLSELYHVNSESMNSYKDSTNKSITYLHDQIGDMKKLVIDNYTNLNQHISEFIGKSNNTVFKGQFGEQFIYDILMSCYPDAIITNNSKNPHESDISFQLSDTPTILIESKFYSSPVPDKEIVKFKYDLDNTGVMYGIFLSFKQKIRKKPKKIEIETYNNKTILYVSCLEFNCSDVILPIEFLLKIIHHFQSESNTINTHLLNLKAKEILQITNKLDVLYSELCQQSQNFITQRNTIIKSLDSMLHDTIQNKMKCQLIIQEIRNDISEELAIFTDLPKKKLLDLSDLPTTQISNIFRILMTSLEKTSYQICKNDSLYFITHSDNSSIFANITIYKNEIKIKVIEANAIFTVNEKKMEPFVKFITAN